MDKRRPHYNLKEIHAQMVSVEEMNLTLSAKQGIRVAGMTQNEALEVIHQLSGTDFYKSMTTHQSNRVWQDVYHAKWREKLLYVKFQQAGEYFVVSFKEL
ncbi:MAG: type II toxin-antitoxin system MqsR family toxin [Desulfuromonadales bacterium]